MLTLLNETMTIACSMFSGPLTGLEEEKLIYTSRFTHFHPLHFNASVSRVFSYLDRPPLQAARHGVRDWHRQMPRCSAHCGMEPLKRCLTPLHLGILISHFAILAGEIVDDYSGTASNTVADTEEYQRCRANPSGCDRLELSSRGLTGALPHDLGDFTNLRTLLLDDNWLESNLSAVALASLTALTELSLDANCLYGTVPTELGQFTALTKLAMGRNDFWGALPSELGQLSSLHTMNFPFVHLYGTLPTELGELAELRHMNVSWSFVEGSIPSELGKLLSAISIDLSSNRLTGSLPFELAALNITLDVSGNSDLCGDHLYGIYTVDTTDTGIGVECSGVLAPFSAYPTTAANNTEQNTTRTIPPTTAAITPTTAPLTAAPTTSSATAATTAPSITTTAPLTAHPRHLQPPQPPLLHPLQRQRL
ncbi:hypothetical protein CYMTET_25017 [Cymbomonas tetramitiformis]|uniref:L domain-like protein n=1 Tax=Cymbomonas tetramitiformis TaxID=36881 RepID=A0AAE0KZN4_9CHLO|nr:hypothetical protein CYMTET_25017 [Cymbomonas tetramitiformis]